jgi:hypothetical protein
VRKILAGLAVMTAAAGLSLLTGGTALASVPTCQLNCPAPKSPIIIDVSGGGFHLTSAANGVRFDFYGNGHLVKMAWIAPGSTDAFLVLPKNGKVTDGAELFGNLTPQPRSADPNGFLALASLNALTGGRTSDVIDSSDPLYYKLRLWQFTSHDGVVGAGRLSTLPQLGIKAIYLNFRTTRMTDRYGNQFRYAARVVSTNPHAGKYAYDVFFASPPGTGASQPASRTAGTGLLPLLIGIPLALLLSVQPIARRRAHRLPVPARSAADDTPRHLTSTT